jgi:carbamoyl-phosphate synthase large subunit
MAIPTRDRLFQVAAALKQGGEIETLYHITGIDPWFLEQIAELVRAEMELENRRLDDLTQEELLRLKRLGFSDRRLAEILNSTEKRVRAERTDYGIVPVRKMVDTCAGEFAAVTPYYYTTYGEADEPLA